MSENGNVYSPSWLDRTRAPTNIEIQLNMDKPLVKF